MVSLYGYQHIEQIAENARYIMYRAQSKRDNLPVILKMPFETMPVQEQRAWFQREHDLLRMLDVPGVIRCYRLEYIGSHPLLVLEDFGGTALNRLGLAGRLDRTTFLHLAISIATCLGQVHATRIIHKNINPGNLFYNPHTDQIKLIDFSLATRLSRQAIAFRSPFLLEGTLAYMSPEQTGRMNRAIDYRTDFYSLGVTLYELLTGQRPFDSDDPLELVHAHLSCRPRPPHQINPDLPPTLSAIIMKLLAKHAEERYQSTYGLVADLISCRDHLNASSDLSTFIPGQNDRAEWFQIPQTIYGRATEITRLTATFERVAEGNRELLLVTGTAGVGKTTLVHEMHRLVTARRGYIIEGTFDQYRRIPYLAWVQAFTDLVNQLLTESDVRLAAWRSTIQSAVGDNGRLLTDIIPNLERIIGTQPDPVHLGNRDARHRFDHVFQNFVNVFTHPNYPLVVFLDNLQWADSDSLHLLHLLLGETNISYLLVIGAYRDTDIFPTHPLLETLADMRQVGATMTLLTLSPLTHTDMNQMVATTLRCSVELAQPLTDLLYARTNGIPVSTIQSLNALYADHRITFNEQAGQWQCDPAHIRSLPHMHDAVTWIAQQVQKLPPETRTLVTLAACIGNQFDLATLAIVAERSPAEISAGLWRALQDGLVVLMSDVDQFVELNAQEDTDSCQYDHLVAGSHTDSQEPTYRFAHDQIQQAAYSLLPKDQQQAMHLRIAHLLRQHTPDIEQYATLFHMVDHVIRGSALLVDPDERYHSAHVLVQAAKKARAATAYSAARNYCMAARSLLPVDSWQQHYNKTLAVYGVAVEVAYLCGDFADMEHLATIVINAAHTLLDQVTVYDIRIQALVAQNQHVEAVALGLHVLTELGVVFPQQPNQHDVALALQETRQACPHHAMTTLLTLPPMTDPLQLAIMQILSRLLDPAYLSSPELYMLLTLKQVNVSLQYGNASISTLSYAGYAMILSGIVGDIDAGYQSGQIAVHVLHQFDAREFQCRVQTMFYAYVAHWKDPIKDMLLPLHSAYHSGMETGDVQFAGYAAVFYSAFAYFAGTEKDLITLQHEALDLSTAVYEMNQLSAFQYYQMLHQALHNLIDGSNGTSDLQGAYYDETVMLSRHVQANDRMGIFYVYLHKLVLAYLFGQYRQAVEASALVEHYLDGATGLPFVPIFYFFDALARLAAYRESPHDQPDDLLQRIAASQAKLDRWAQYAPINYRHMYDLVEAMRLHLFGDKWAALEAYERAIDGANTHGYMREKALANELAALFYLDCGHPKLARVYMQAAYASYAQWGATAKIAQLEQCYAALLAPILVTPSRSPRLMSPPAASDDSSSTGNASSILDIATVVKASQAIAGDIDGARLLTQLMRMAIDSTGAQRGVLILEKAGDWVIEAQGDVNHTDITVLQALTIQTPMIVPTGIVSYVIRTHDCVVLQDATVEGAFTSDAYIQQQQTRSVLCIPLLNRSRMSGILYLENNLIPGAFTYDRVELLTLVSAQMAMALDNARLYASLEAKVAECTRELAGARASAEEAHWLKSQFLANMSHELRTPLNAIINFTRFLSKERYGTLNTRQQELQQRVLANADHLLGLINDFLDLSKLDVGRVDLFREVIDLSPMLQGIMSTAVGLTRDKNLALNLDVPENLPLVNADKTRIRQVVLTLLANAARYTQQGAITLRAQVISEQAIRIEVEDTGIGIAPEQQTLIFEEFRQVQSSFQREYQGSGLGLPISKRLVELHGGQMGVRSTPGQGATFFFTLSLAYPLTAEASPDHALVSYTIPSPTTVVPNQSPPEAGGISAERRDIVVIDDDPSTQEILRTYLEPAGYTVHGVYDSRLALTTIQHVHPGLIILDVLMPHLNGWDVLVQLKSHPDLAAIPVLLCTIVERQRMGLMLGAADYLVKPIYEAEILARVQRILSPPATVLVIDDDPDARQVIRTILETQHYCVLEAADGESGLCLLESTPPDLLVLDLLMPQMDGFAVLDRLRSVDRWTQLPVIVVTAMDLDTTERAWLQERTLTCMQKRHLSADEFLSTILHILTMHKASDRPEPP